MSKCYVILLNTLTENHFLLKKVNVISKEGLNVLT